MLVKSLIYKGFPGEQVGVEKMQLVSYKYIKTPSKAVCWVKFSIFAG